MSTLDIAIPESERLSVSRALIAINAMHSPPVLEASTRDLMTSVQDPYIDILGLVVEIERQPAMTARLLGLANSAMYSPDPPVTAVKDAVIRVLGMDLTRGVVLGFVLAAAFSTEACESFDDRSYWQDALTLARLSREYADIAGAQEEVVTLAYLAGLLHRLGLLVGAAADPVQWHAVLVNSDGEPLANRLQTTLGYHHRHTSQAIASLWTLPADIRESLVESPPLQSAGWLTWVAKGLLDATEAESQEMVDATCQQHAELLSCKPQTIERALEKARSEGQLSLTG